MASAPLQRSRETPSAFARDADGESETTLGVLLTQLGTGTKAERVQAALELRNHGSDAVLPLCAMLKRKDENLCLEAARSLGIIGDSRAVKPLIATLRANCIGGSLREQRRAAIRHIATTLCTIIAGCVLMQLVMGSINPVLAGYFATAGSFSSWAKQRSTRGQVFRAVTKALEQIAEANPTPALREVLPDLDELSGDALQQDGKTRRILRAAADRIDALTEEMRSLPIAAAAPAPAVSVLPTPASSRPPESDILPRVRS